MRAACLAAAVLAVLAPAAGFCAVGSHTLEARVASGGKVYRQTLKLTEGSQGNFVGPVRDKEMILNGLLSRDGEGLVLQYQLELSGGRGAQGRSIQAQAEVALAPGRPLRALDCGPWSVTLTLDPAKAAAPKESAAWDPAGLPNYRLSADLSSDGSGEVCRVVSRADAQSNAVDGILEGGRKFGFILNSLFTPGKDGFRLQYQVEKNMAAGARTVQLQNEETLVLNKKTRVPGEGFKLELLLEGPPARPDGRGASGGKTYGTVPIIE